MKMEPLTARMGKVTTSLEEAALTQSEQMKVPPTFGVLGGDN